MTEDEIDRYSRYKFIEKCEICDLDITVFTQEDSFPEYYTNVYVKCTCGNCVLFELPVN